VRLRAFLISAPAPAPALRPLKGRSGARVILRCYVRLDRVLESAPVTVAFFTSAESRKCAEFHENGGILAKFRVFTTFRVFPTFRLPKHLLNHWLEQHFALCGKFSEIDQNVKKFQEFHEISWNSIIFSLIRGKIENVSFGGPYEVLLTLKKLEFLFFRKMWYIYI